MTTLYITPYRVDSTDSEGQKFLVRTLLLETEGVVLNLHADEPLTITTPFEVRRLKKAWGKVWSRRMYIPEPVLTAMNEFLRKYQGKQHTLDCYDFVGMAYKVRRHDKRYFYRFWKEARKFRRKPGDVVFLLTRKTQYFHHAAVYIGDGLYVSVYGKSGDLEITTLRDMKCAYKASDALTMVVKT